MHILFASTTRPSTGPTASPSCPRARRCHGHRERLLWPGCASLPGPGPAPAPGLIMDKSPTPGVPLQGALKKQAGPGTRPAGMDGTELGAHACDCPPVCKHTCAHTWVLLHAKSHAHIYASASTHDHAHACTQMIMQTHSCSGTHTLTHMFTCTDTHIHTWPSSPAQLQCLLSAPRGKTLGYKTAPRCLGPMLCAVPQFPLLAQPGSPNPPGPVGPSVAQGERGTLKPRQAQGLAQLPLPRTTRQRSPADSAAKCRSSPLPPAKPAVTRPAPTMGRSIIAHLFSASPSSIMAKFSPGRSERILGDRDAPSTSLAP